MTKCPVKWNPVTWPYVTSCSLERGHVGRHQDKAGNELLNIPGQEEAEGD